MRYKHFSVLLTVQKTNKKKKQLTLLLTFFIINITSFSKQGVKRITQCNKIYRKKYDSHGKLIEI